MPRYGLLERLIRKNILTYSLASTLALLLAGPVALCGCGDWTMSDEIPLVEEEAAENQDAEDPNEPECAQLGAACSDELPCCDALTCTDYDEDLSLSVCLSL